MEPILFYGVPHGCSFGAIVALEWLGEPYRLCRIDMLAQPKAPLYARVNPLQQTPSLLLEDGQPLTESFAILQHIANRDLSRQLGFRQGTREFDRLNHALAYLHTSLHSAFTPLWKAYKLDDGAEKRMLQAIGREDVAGCYAYLERLLAGRDWLAGGTARTVADAYLIAVARWGEDLGVFDLKREYPRLHQHMQKLEADPAVIFAHAIEDERSATSSGRFLGHVSLQELQPRLAA